MEAGCMGSAACARRRAVRMGNRLWSRREFLSPGGACGRRALGGALPLPRVSTDYRSIVLADQPVGYWRLGERRGPVARDETCHRDHGTYHGRVRYAEAGALVRDPDGAARLNGRDA